MTVALLCTSKRINNCTFPKKKKKNFPKKINKEKNKQEDNTLLIKLRDPNLIGAQRALGVLGGCGHKEQIS